MTVKEVILSNLDEVAQLVERISGQLGELYKTALNGKTAKVREGAISVLTDTRISAVFELDRLFDGCWPT